LYTVSELARYLNVSRLYIYRVVKGLGPPDGVFTLPSHSGSQMIRIDPGRFLHRHTPPAVASVDRKSAARLIKATLGEMVPLLKRLGDWVQDMEHLYDELTADADDDTDADGNCGAEATEGEQGEPKKAACGP
jgi:hypothetical protein